jgi:acyl carrier protein
MDPTALKTAIKELIVRELNLEGRDPASIDDQAQLFGATRAGQTPSLGLDSLDALQLAMSIEEKFGVRIPEGPEARSIFASVATIAAYVAEHPASPVPSAPHARV